MTVQLSIAETVNLRSDIPKYTDYTGINTGNPEKTYRQRTFRAYLPNDEVRRRMKTKNYSFFENPTGIFFAPKEEVTLTLKGTEGHPVALIVRDFDVGGTQDTYPLHEGANTITIKNQGLGYFDYRDTNPATAHPINVTISGGKINGVFTRQDSAATWERLLLNAKCNILDLLGERCQLTYDVKSLRKYCPTRGPELLELYDRIIELEQDDILGWGLDKSHPGNHIHGRVQWKGYMQADGLGGAYHVDTMNTLADVDKLRKSSWGVGHEFGHVNQTRPGMLWRGTTEITNNICSAWVDYNLDPTYSRLEHEMSPNADRINMRGGRLDCFVDSAIVKHQLWQFQDGPDKGLMKPLKQFDSGDVFVGFAPFWQLMLYNTVARGNKAFYPNIYHDVRVTNEEGMTNGQLRVLFMKRVCDSAKLNFADYFIKTGMAAPVDREVDDYGKAFITVTDEMVQEMLDYISRYPKPDSDVIYYICTNNVDIFRKRLPIKKSADAPKIKLPVGKIDIPGDAWENAVAFEAYQGKTLLRVSLRGINHEDNTTTTVTCPPETDCIKAVQWDGKRVTIARLSDDPEVRKEWKKAVKISHLFRAIREGNVKELKRGLKGVDVNGVSSADNGNSLLAEAIGQKNTRAVKVLLEAGANANERRRDNKYMLHAAAGVDDAEAVSLLLEHGADPMARSGNGGYAIHEAVWNNGIHALRKLLPCYKKDNFNPDGGVNGFPVKMAMSHNHADMLAEFIKCGMDVNADCFAAEPLLILAVKLNNEEMVRMLLEAGADKTATDAQGKSAADYAKDSLLQLLK